MRTATITRQKCYPRPARPGPAWHWIYTVDVTGEQQTFAQGSGLRSCESWIRRRFPDAQIVRDWPDLRNEVCNCADPESSKCPHWTTHRVRA